MRKVSRFFSAAFVGVCFLALTGCDPNVVEEQNAEIPKYIWNLNYKPSFEVPIEDTVSRYNIYVNVRHTTYYTNSNLWIRITTILPDSTKLEKAVNLPLANDEGKWFGDCLGDICDARVQIQEDAILKQAGKYTFQFEQIMRTDDLPFIMSMGIRVEKAEKKAVGTAQPQ